MKNFCLFLFPVNICKDLPPKLLKAADYILQGFQAWVHCGTSSKTSQPQNKANTNTVTLPPKKQIQIQLHSPKNKANTNTVTLPPKNKANTNTVTLQKIQIQIQIQSHSPKNKANSIIFHCGTSFKNPQRTK